MSKNLGNVEENNFINKNYYIITFRGRSKETGEWVVGNYFYQTRKGSGHFIVTFYDNNEIEIYRESLQLKGFDGEFKNVESFL